MRSNVLRLSIAAWISHAASSLARPTSISTCGTSIVGFSGGSPAAIFPISLSSSPRSAPMCSTSSDAARGVIVTPCDSRP